MFTKKDPDGYLSPAKGVLQKTLVFGEKTLMTEFVIEKGRQVPRHSHPHEQTGYLISGEILLFIDSESHACGPGDSWCIPGHAEHGAQALADAVVVEVFSPVREDYLPKS